METGGIAENLRGSPFNEELSNDRYCTTVSKAISMDSTLNAELMEVRIHACCWGFPWKGQFDLMIQLLRSICLSSVYVLSSIFADDM